LLPGFPIEWVSSDPAVATVDAGGVVSGLRFGTARIAASASGRRATVPVEVRPAVTTDPPRAPSPAANTCAARLVRVATSWHSSDPACSSLAVPKGEAVDAEDTRLPVSASPYAVELVQRADPGGLSACVSGISGGASGWVWRGWMS